MKRFYTLEHKASTIIKHFREIGFKISEDESLYKPHDISKLCTVADEHNVIIVITRKNSTEVIAGNNLILDRINELNLVEGATDDTDSFTKSITQHVVNSLKKGGINNPQLLNELEAQSEDCIENKVEANEMFILEPFDWTDMEE